MKVYGIRHHGPGSARRLVEALREQPPAAILIEGPPEADSLISWVTHPGMEPPVAILVYRPDRPEHAVYYPFARFSPEWQAMRLGQEMGIPIHFIDLPPAYLWRKAEDQPASSKPARADWMKAIAEQAGFTDGEKWWEATVETKGDQAPAVFAALLDLMRTVRHQPEWEATVDDGLLLREAYMRREIRRAQKKYGSNLAIVCGAFHGPALADLPPLKSDQAKLKGLKKVKTAATWIPWTYERLSYLSGYGAGVYSPAWYELLYDVARDRLVSTWTTQAARLFRAEGRSASPAHAMEAGRLAHSLAMLRGRTEPRLEELMEAVQSVMADGKETPMQLIERQLIVGVRMGQVPEEVPELPLQKHIKTEQRRLRLKPKSGEQGVKLDLRQAFHLEKSQLLHRLALLDVPWGQTETIEGALGTFRELWKLNWQPECELAVIEAAFWGNTLDKACENRLRRTLAESESLPTVTDLLQYCFLAGLANPLPRVLKRLRKLSALERDPDHLLQTLPTLVEMLRYGDVRQIPATQLQPVLIEMLPRLWVALPQACHHLDEDFAQHRWRQIAQLHQSMGMLAAFDSLAHGPHRLAWTETLNKIARDEAAHPLIMGGVVRLLFEQESWTAEETALAMSRILSPGTRELDAAAWIEGFLHGSGALLIHQPRLFELLDQWIQRLSEERFQAALPLLRRTFSHFAVPERKTMGEMAARQGKGSGITPTATEARDQGRMDEVQRVLDLLLSPGE